MKTKTGGKAEAREPYGNARDMSRGESRWKHEEARVQGGNEGREVEVGRPKKNGRKKKHMKELAVLRGEK